MHDGAFLSARGEMAIAPDMAALIDREEDILAEEFGCSPKLVRSILDWERKRDGNEVEIEKRMVQQLRTLVAELIKPGNIIVRAWALAYASGLAAQLFGARSQVEKADQLGITRADMSHFVCRWKRKLGLTNTLFSRNEDAVKNSRRARLKKIANGN